ncbi:hypothetical protein Tco_1044996 [Tanacetum coccineum]|uniref:Uncharacterized protein n=1 Tax=Tanacetum coccineum TaxID=301880 RepID=A0ABQ5GRH2_9ASTR
MINDLKKCGYKKDNCELRYKFLNNLQPEWKQYGTLIRQTKNLMDINIDALYNILKQNQGDVNDAIGYKKKVVVVTSDPLALVAEKTKDKHKRKVQTRNQVRESEKKKRISKLNEMKHDFSKLSAIIARRKDILPKTARKQSQRLQLLIKNKELLSKERYDEQGLPKMQFEKDHLCSACKQGKDFNETSQGECFHEISKSFQEESSSSSMNDGRFTIVTEVMVPPTNTQSISNESVPNVNEASPSHQLFNEQLEYAYFDASTTFHNPSNVYTFYQPYPQDKKWTKDHPLHKIIGDPKSSVHTRGQLANSCLFACLLSSIEPANVAEALKDVEISDLMITKLHMHK